MKTMNQPHGVAIGCIDSCPNPLRAMVVNILPLVVAGLPSSFHYGSNKQSHSKSKHNPATLFFKSPQNHFPCYFCFS